jgi:exopolysaccharide biosynthesis protein
VEILFDVSQITVFIINMKRLLITLACLMTAISAWAECPDSLAFANATWKVTELEKGACAMYAQIAMFNSVQSVCVIKYPAKKFKTEFLHRPEKEADKPSIIGTEAMASFALNGSYFNMKDRTPTVYFRIGDEVLGKTHPTEVYRVDGVFALKDKKGRKAVIALSDTTEYEAVAGRYHSVLAAGPTLIIDEEVIVPMNMGNAADGANVAAAMEDQKKKGSTKHYSSAQFYDKRHPRTAIGTDEEGYIYYVVIDGRFNGQADGASIWETARICELLGMTNAINLDGGGSTTLWAKDTGVINHPCDNKVFDHDGERKVPNLLIAR